MSLSSYSKCDSWGCVDPPGAELVIKSKRANNHATEVYCNRHATQRLKEIRATTFLKLITALPVNAIVRQKTWFDEHKP